MQRAVCVPAIRLKRAHLKHARSRIIAASWYRIAGANGEASCGKASGGQGGESGICVPAIGLPSLRRAAHLHVLRRHLLALQDVMAQEVTAATVYFAIAASVSTARGGRGEVHEATMRGAGALAETSRAATRPLTGSRHPRHLRARKRGIAAVVSAGGRFALAMADAGGRTISP